ADLIRHWGYPVEEHDVITADGYILSMLRIPYGRQSTGNSSCHHPPVLFVHGMILADAGFDVFLLNVRGTTTSQRHLNVTKNDQEFWKFTADDMAKYDAPAAIERALQLTGASSLHWIGHSQSPFELRWIRTRGAAYFRFPMNTFVHPFATGVIPIPS
ncbi:hypothetical protein PMAYCL1PPCAC_16310, partial [Pristionchus mayeri]